MKKIKMILFLQHNCLNMSLYIIKRKLILTYTVSDYKLKIA